MLSEIPPDVVGENDPIDPDTQVLLYADELAEGMWVLNPPEKRMSLHEELMRLPAGKAKAMVCNRWCRVTKLRKSDLEVCFVGIYDDEDQRLRRSSPNEGWHVLKTSIPPATVKEMNNDA